MSNYTDFVPLSREERVAVHYIEKKEDLSDFDALIIPDTENLTESLQFLAAQDYPRQLASLIKGERPSSALAGALSS